MGAKCSWEDQKNLPGKKDMFELKTEQQLITANIYGVC